jgi:hypothetical protein
MSESQTHTTSTGSKDPREPRRDLFGMDSETLADLQSGITRAISEGFRAYANEINPDNVRRMGFDGGMVEGFVAGSASLFEELAKTTRRVLEDTRAVRERRSERKERQATAAPQIDYERLAQHIAAEMQKNAPKK